MPRHGEIKELSAIECRRLLERSRFGHLACHASDEVYLVPITFNFEDGYLYSHSRPGKKIEMMRKTSNICIQVEEVQDFFHWKSVISWGRFEELKGAQATAAMRQMIQKMTKNESDQRRSELEVDLSALLETAIIYRIKIEKTTGRYEGALP